MKTIKFSGKLFLEKTAIAQLDDNQLASINGGAARTNTCSATCATYTCATYTCPQPCSCGCSSNG